MKSIQLSLLSLLLCQLFIFNVSYAQGTANKVDQLVNEAIEKFNVAGIAVAIVKDGEVIHNKGYGVTSSKTKEKVNENTRFAIASNSKAFTSAALAILIDEGKLNWTDKVVDHVPEFKMYDDYVTANFTILDLLTHRSGLGLGAGDLMFFPDGSDFTIDDLLSSFQYQKKVSDFRTKFDYDNLLYVVAGEVVARISGMSWSKFVESNIMKPIGMDGSAGTYQRLTDKRNVAMPHSTVDGQLHPLETFDMGMGAAAGGIYASVNDLTKWMLLHLNEGQHGETTVFSKRNYREMWTPHTNLWFNPKADPPYKTHFSAYGLGWFIRDLNGYVIYDHTGGLPGMLSKTTIIPELNLGIIVLTNTDPGGGPAFSAISNAIIDQYLELEDFGWVDKYAARLKANLESGDEVVDKVWETVRSANDDHLKADDFTGIYEDKWFGKVEVFLKDKQLWIKCHRSPKLNGPLSFYNANTFVVKWAYQDMNADAFAMFTLDEKGKAQSIKMKGISPNIDFSFDFQDLNLERVVKE
ncbi:serine hydrolase [Neolewinella persica]|uniref:serine hydrolase n=1 Tax=Neolewinella persica TaxID=70998 RepID=UPI000376B50F|nr:serine hydrolase [Neolewinella persica]